MLQQYPSVTQNYPPTENNCIGSPFLYRHKCKKNLNIQLLSIANSNREHLPHLIKSLFIITRKYKAAFQN